MLYIRQIGCDFYFASVGAGKGPDAKAEAVHFTTVTIGDADADYRHAMACRAILERILDRADVAYQFLEAKP